MNNYNSNHFYNDHFTFNVSQEVQEAERFKNYWIDCFGPPLHLNEHLLLTILLGYDFYFFRDVVVHLLKSFSAEEASASHWWHSDVVLLKLNIARSFVGLNGGDGLRDRSGTPAVCVCGWNRKEDKKRKNIFCSVKKLINNFLTILINF